MLLGTYRAHTYRGFRNMASPGFQIDSASPGSLIRKKEFSLTFHTHARIVE